VSKIQHKFNVHLRCLNYNKNGNSYTIEYESAEQSPAAKKKKILDELGKSIYLISIDFSSAEKNISAFA